MTHSNFQRNISLTSISQTFEHDRVEWFVIFEARRHEFWFDYFCDLRFAHVWALKWDGFNWIAVNPYVGYTDVQIMGFQYRTQFKEIVKNKRWVKVEARVEKDRLRVPWILTTPWCVDVIKSLLGIHKPFIISPKQLWNYLTDGQKSQDAKAKHRAKGT